MDEQIVIALTPRRPHWTVLLGYGEVGAADASALGAQHRIRDA
jgi:hypothetical protein